MTMADTPTSEVITVAGVDLIVHRRPTFYWVLEVTVAGGHVCPIVLDYVADGRTRRRMRPVSFKLSRAGTIEVMGYRLKAGTVEPWLRTRRGKRSRCWVYLGHYDLERVQTVEVER